MRIVRGRDGALENTSSSEDEESRVPEVEGSVADESEIAVGVDRRPSEEGWKTCDDMLEFESEDEEDCASQSGWLAMGAEQAGLRVFGFNEGDGLKESWS